MSKPTPSSSVKYKDTLLLPKTDFPMRANLAEREPQMVARWQREDTFGRMVAQNQDSGRARPFVLHDGPPYANGHIHLGHVLNKVLKDVIVKFRNLNGEAADYVPGWDCHGLPIELQVVKDLGGKRAHLGHAEFRDACRAYAQKFVEIQRQEFQRLGVFGRWQNPYLTMKFTYQAAIIRALGRIAEKGFVYKDKKPIYWCISCATALAEAEIEYENHRSPSVYVRFPMDDSKRKIWQKEEEIYFLIWTTTPWTLPANLAICLHPDFEYVLVRTAKFGNLILAGGLLESVMKGIGESEFAVLGKWRGRQLAGLTYQSILNGRTGKIILGEYVTLDQGTGCVHTAPGHGYDDYVSGLREGLEIYSPVGDHGEFSADVKGFAGMKVFDANPRIVAHLKESGFLVAEQAIEHSYPHCWRCKKPVIFRATPQWFLSLGHQHLREKALAEIERVRWIPPWGKDRIFGMIENRPDWCLSRQRSWGVPIPAIYCMKCNWVGLEKKILESVVAKVEKEGANCWWVDDVRAFLPDGFSCPQCSAREFRKETDILDVWFDSGISYAAVEEEYARLGFPVDLYLEGSDQHRGWFHSALLTAVATREAAPYRTVLTHGFVVDGKGHKMSKSAGNYISAQDAVKQYGAEILRLWVCAEDYRNDIRISKEIMDRLTEAYRKIRNTERFLLGALGDFQPDRHLISDPKKMTEVDRFLLDRLHHLASRVWQAYQDYEFHMIYHAVYNFCIVDLSAFYLDLLKDRLYVEQADDPKRRSSQSAIWFICRTLSLLMAPILSVTSEEVWSYLPKRRVDSDSVFLAHLELEKLSAFADPSLVVSFGEFLQIRAEIYKALEMAREQKRIGHSLEAVIRLSRNARVENILASRRDGLPFLLIVSQVEWVDGRPEGEVFYASEEVKGLEIAVAHAAFPKCQRCWNYRPDVNRDTVFPETCGRCAEVLRRTRNA